ncbi:MAG: haloalkane dehalogenase [Rhodobiaceae bacterium]|nr:MAG: haloalkane dehalogenase [Rhodobiaceae bacterium]
MGLDFELTRRGALTVGLAAGAVTAIPANAAEKPIGTAPLPSKRAKALDLEMAYVEIGEGDPIVFLHGNPTSSYLWRNIMPYASAFGRCIAPDLIGMGGSDKRPLQEGEDPDARYSFFEHQRYLDALLENLGVTENVTLVIHDWGSALGFDWARRNEDKVKGICFMEGFTRPFSYSEMDWVPWAMFKAFKSDLGDWMALEQNMFVEQILPASILREMTEEEMSYYRAPYLNAGEDRRPTLTWPREVPFDGEPKSTHEMVARLSEWLKTNDIPKLFVNAEPGALIQGEVRDFVRTWRNQQEITVRGIHFIQEDSPHEIGAALEKWLPSL